MAYLVAYVCQLVGDDDCQPLEKRDQDRDGVQRLFWHFRAPRDQKFQGTRVCAILLMNCGRSNLQHLERLFYEVDSSSGIIVRRLQHTILRPWSQAPLLAPVHCGPP